MKFLLLFIFVFMQNQKVKVGDQVPSFELANQHGDIVSSDSFIGRPFVIYFYPKDDTPGCTAEACSFRDQYEDFKDIGAEVIGVSADSPQSHLRFAEKHNLPFILLSDKNNELRSRFGVPSSFFGLFPGRVTYVVDNQGVVQHVFDSQLQAKKHVKEAIKHLQN